MNANMNGNKQIVVAESNKPAQLSQSPDVHTSLWELPNTGYTKLWELPQHQAPESRHGAGYGAAPRAAADLRLLWRGRRAMRRVYRSRQARLSVAGWQERGGGGCQ